jgi:PAS domain S-box-containing protein
MIGALVLTHAFWRVFQHTPFLVAFAAAILSTRIGGRQAGFLAVTIGVLGFVLFPPSLPDNRMALLFGFIVISTTFSWLVARRYEIEADLRDSQERLRAVISHVPIVLWMMNREGYVTLAEGSGLEVLDLKPRELVGRSVFDLYKEVPDVVANTRRALSGETFTATVALGEVVVETWYSPLRDHQGFVTGAIGVSLDVTERIAAEQVVIRSERRLQTMIDAEPACVKLVSREGLLLDMNRAGLAMIGAKDIAEVIGRPIIGLVHSDDHIRYQQMHAAACSGSPATGEFRIVGVDGVERWVDSHAVPFDASRDGREPSPAVLSVSSDITDRKLLEDQLRQSQKIEAIGLLAGGIAHDFNNLLTAIGGYTDLVFDTLDERDERREDLREVAKATQRAAAMTRQLLAFSRRQILQSTVIDVNEMVIDIQRLLRRTIPENIELDLEIGPTVNAVRADRGQLEQVAVNLAINAGDAMPQGGRLRIITDTVDVDDAWARRHPPMPVGQYVRLSVSDTGIGMSPETQARIFEPFFTTKERGEGTGLGLATVYGIVKQSGGFIWVDSKPGRGTTFSVLLPSVREPVDQPVSAAPVDDTPTGSQTILLAEDDAAVRRLARNVLANQGYTVLDARDGDEALAIAQKYRGPIHLLITDVVMPGMGGRDLAIRLATERPKIRVLYTSGYTENVMMRAGFQHGLLLLDKPFLPADLLLKVKQLLATAA